jgi:chemotaxis protein MotB
MPINLTAAAQVIPLTAVMLGACVAQSAYEKEGAELQQARAQAAAEQSQIAKMQQEQKWVVAGTCCFRRAATSSAPMANSRSTNTSPSCKACRTPKSSSTGTLQPAGRTPLKRAGIANNIDLSSRRADNVVAYLESQGVNANIVSAKGFGDTHPIAANDTPDGRAKNRRIEIVLEGSGA